MFIIVLSDWRPSRSGCGPKLRQVQTAQGTLLLGLGEAVVENAITLDELEQ